MTQTTPDDGTFRRRRAAARALVALFESIGDAPEMFVALGEADAGQRYLGLPATDADRLANCLNRNVPDFAGALSVLDSALLDAGAGSPDLVDIGRSLGVAADLSRSSSDPEDARNRLREIRAAVEATAALFGTPRLRAVRGGAAG